MQTWTPTAEVSHRGGMALPAKDLHPPADILPRIGGSETVAKIIDGLYDRIETDSVLRPMFGRNLHGEREAQRVFFHSWLGGDPGDYAGHGAGMKSRHEGLFISKELAGRWLGHFRASVAGTVADDGASNALLRHVQALALALVNRPGPPEPSAKLRFCEGSEVRALRKPVTLDDDASVKAFFQDGRTAAAADLESLLQFACAMGLSRSAEALLDCGVDPNHAGNHARGVPGQTTKGIHRVLVTPLCVALARKRFAVAELLRSRGAKYDVFTAAFLGDVPAIKSVLDAAPGLADVADPATDVYAATPILHAVFAGHLDATETLLRRGAHVGPFGGILVRWAAENGDHRLPDLLLRHGGHGREVGPGKWIKDSVLASSLRAAGADVNTPAGLWIWVACTGNSGHREDVAFVRALLEAGCDVHATYAGASALHYAARAGFLQVARLLIERGAQVDGVDNTGLRPIDWAVRAGKAEVEHFLVGL